MSRTSIGRILLEDQNGKPRASILWDLPPSLRTLELTIDDGVYGAHRQTPEGMWVYRWVRQAGDSRADDYLTEVKYPTDPDWDGPAYIPPPVPTWKDCQFDLEVLIKESARNKGLINARQLLKLIPKLKAAFDKVPYTPPVERAEGKPARPPRAPQPTPREVTKERTIVAYDMERDTVRGDR